MKLSPHARDSFARTPLSWTQLRHPWYQTLCLAEWVLLVRCHLPRLPLLYQPERLAVPASSSFFCLFVVIKPENPYFASRSGLELEVKLLRVYPLGPCFDWCCFYYFVRNRLVALLEALCAREQSDFFELCFCETVSLCDWDRNLSRWGHSEAQWGRHLGRGPLKGNLPPYTSLYPKSNVNVNTSPTSNIEVAKRIAYRISSGLAQKSDWSDIWRTPPQKSKWGRSWR